MATGSYHFNLSCLTGTRGGLIPPEEHVFLPLVVWGRQTLMISGRSAALRWLEDQNRPQRCIAEAGI